MRLDSCRQCVRRRIKCDAGIPQCAKCIKKGIQCSGVGKQYHFVEGHTARGKRNVSPRTETTASNDSKQLSRVVHRPSTAQEDLFDFNDRLSSASLFAQGAPPLSQGFIGFDASSPIQDIAIRRYSDPPRGNAFALSDINPLSNPEGINPTLRMLFDHFSKTIAPAMVVIDQRSNGYRDIILPLATQDTLVGRAVSVVSGLHLGAQNPGLLVAAEKGRSVIIEKLRKNASCGRPDQIFTLSTWATIILLLVGETVTGDQEFIPLFAMLKSLLENLNSLPASFPDAFHFLMQQSQMFKLFTPLFLDPERGQDALDQQLDTYFDFLVYPELQNTELSVTLNVLRQAIHLSRNLYLQETRNEFSTAERKLIVENLRQLLLPIRNDLLGMHAFVWCYFIAGASSEDWELREFFAARLREVYNKTKMRNILVAIETLESLVWRLPPDQNWTHCPAVLNRALIM